MPLLLMVISSLLHVGSYGRHKIIKFSMEMIWVNCVCLNHIYSLHSDVLVHLSNDAIQKPIRQVKWIPPLNNIIKVNIDSSSLSKPGRSGFGGLIRNNMVIGC